MGLNIPGSGITRGIPGLPIDPQKPAQPGNGLVMGTANRLFGNPEASGDFRHRAPLPVHQLENPALLLGERVKGQARHFLGRIALNRVPRCGDRVRAALHFAASHRQTLAAELLDGHASSNDDEVGGEPRSRRIEGSQEPRVVPQQAHEDFLGEVLDLVRSTSACATNDSHHQRSGGMDEEIPRGAISGHAGGKIDLVEWFQDDCFVPWPADPRPQT